MTQTDLYRSSDQKTQASRRVRNAFGLPAGKDYSCPGATSICDSVCYAGKIEKRYKAVHARLNANLELLRSLDIVGMTDALRIMLWQFAAECDKKGVEKKFRIHWDGDFFSRGYAIAWAAVIQEFPEIQFWVYTRSFVPGANVIPILSGIDNLELYLSIDADNEEHAPHILAEYPDVLPSVLSDTMDNAADIMVELVGKPGAKCPELIGAIPLTVDNAEKTGACIACNLCPGGKAPIRFAHKKAGRK